MDLDFAQGNPQTHPLVQDYYVHQPFKESNRHDETMTQVEIMINGKGPYLAYVTNLVARRSEPNDIFFKVDAPVWPPPAK